jgi:predicted PurR-regulated permease PerM
MSVVIFWISNLIIIQFSKFDEALPSYILKLNNIISSTASAFGITDEMFTNFDLVERLKELNYAGIAESFFSSTLTIFSSTFFVLFFFIFVNSGYKKIYQAIKERYHGEDHSSEETKSGVVESTFKNISSQIQNYLGTKVLVSLLTALLVGIVLWIFGIDFVLVWIVITFLLNFIPNIGSVIAVLLPTLMTLVQYESFGYMIVVAVIIAVIQNLIGNILEPKIMGDRLGLNPLVILLSLLLWGYIWGIAGMFLSVPLAGVVKIILSQSDSKNLKFLSSLMDN